MTIRRVLTALAMLALFVPALAQSPQDEIGTWWIYNGTLRFTDEWNVFTEAQLRTYELTSNPQEAFVRVAGQYDFTPKIMVGLGYARIRDWAFDDMVGEDSTEDRIYQQFQLRHHVQRTRFEHRYRFEQRWVHHDDGTSYSNRFRYRLQITAPLNRKTLEPGAWFLNAFDEIFIRLGSEPTFDQNRVYFAGGYQFNRHANLQIGALWQARADADFFRLQVFLTYNFDFRKKM